MDREVTREAVDAAAELQPAFPLRHPDGGSGAVCGAAGRSERVGERRGGRGGIGAGRSGDGRGGGGGEGEGGAGLRCGHSPTRPRVGSSLLGSEPDYARRSIPGAALVIGRCHPAPLEPPPLLRSRAATHIQRQGLSTLGHGARPFLVLMGRVVFTRGWQ